MRDWKLFRFRAGFDPGYAPKAIASYARFVAMRGAGKLPAGVRFQLCLPTRMTVGYWFVSPSACPTYSPPTNAHSGSGSRTPAPQTRITTSPSSGTCSGRCWLGSAISRNVESATRRTPPACWRARQHGAGAGVTR